MFVSKNIPSKKEIVDAAWNFQKSMTQGVQFAALGKDEIMKIGQQLWEVSYAETEDDLGAYERMVFWARNNSPIIEAGLVIPSDQIMMVGAARWADQGFPQVVIGSKYAAALMATQLPDWAVENLRLPWKAFLLEIPDKILPIIDEKNREAFLRRVMVQETTMNGKQYFQYVAISESATTVLWKHGCDGVELSANRRKDNGVWEGAAFALPVEGVDAATQDLLGRLIANVALALTNPENVTTPKGNAVGSTGKRAKEPKSRIYTLGKPVKVDVRQALNDFIHGRRRNSPTVQTLVRGHWKPKLAERVGHPVWVEPYWRGDDAAPITVRAHYLGKDA